MPCPLAIDTPTKCSLSSGHGAKDSINIYVCPPCPDGRLLFMGVSIASGHGMEKTFPKQIGGLFELPTLHNAHVWSPPDRLQMIGCFFVGVKSKKPRFFGVGPLDLYIIYCKTVLDNFCQKKFQKFCHARTIRLDQHLSIMRGYSGT